MFKKLITFLLLVSVLGCSKHDEIPIEEELHSQALQELWRENVNAVLKDPLWNANNAYDASTVLMVPMHYAYKHHERFLSDPRIGFDNFFKAVNSGFMMKDLENRVVRTQFIYFVTQYLKLNESQISKNSFMESLYSAVERELIDLWFVEQAPHWDRNLKFKGIAERLQWKLDTSATEKSYFRAVIDEEWASLSALNDLIYISNNTHLSISFDARLVTELSERVISEFGSFEEELFYFQRGVWYDHPDYIYAGNDRIYADIIPFPVEGIAVDSSHSHRLPLWLSSLKDAANNPNIFDKAKKGLTKTFETKTFEIQYISGRELFLQTNFLDGNNGVYRLNYSTQGDGIGYEAYQLSGTLFVGYYLFLESDLYSKQMLGMAKQFPLLESELLYYVGPNTSRERHPRFVWPDYFNNGFALLFASLASCYNTSLVNCAE